MDGLSFRQGTIYRNKADHTTMILIHHNPMALQSIAAIPAGSGQYRFGRISVDDIIAIRKSGQFEEQGDLPAGQLVQVLDQLLDSKLLSEEERAAVDAIRKERHPEQ